MDINDFKSAIKKELKVNFGEEYDLDAEDVYIVFREPTQEELYKLQFIYTPETIDFGESEAKEKRSFQKEQLKQGSTEQDKVMLDCIIDHSFTEGNKPVSKNKVWNLVKSKPDIYAEIRDKWTETFFTNSEKKKGKQ